MFGFGKKNGSKDKSKAKSDKQQPQQPPPSQQPMASDKGKKKGNVDLLAVLEQVPLLSTLTSEDRKKLAAGLSSVDFAKGDFLMKEGEDGDSFMIIVEGEVNVMANGQIVAKLEPGDYAGEQALLQNAKRNASLTAASANVKCFVCSQKLFKSMLENNKSIKFAKRDAKRKAFMTAVNLDDVDEKDIVEVDDEQIEWLLQCVEENLLFRQLTISQRKEVLQFMKPKTVKKGEKVIKQGDVGDKASTFYVVESGDYDVQVDGVKVFSYAKGGAFGELALMHNMPRAATIECVTASANAENKLWEITRQKFRYALTKSHRNRHKQGVDFLKTVDLFKPLLSAELSHLNDALEAETYRNKKGTVIFKEGEAGNKFYVIKKGTVRWSKGKGDGAAQKGQLQQGQYFGERALRTKEKRAATISIDTNKEVVLLSMTGRNFEELLGPVLNMVDEQIQQYRKVDQERIKKKKKHRKKKGDASSGSSSGDTHKKVKLCGLKDLKTIGVLGKGGFGLVTLVQDPKTKASYALKAIKKHQVVELELQKHIISEKLVMDQLTNQFLVNLHCTYKDALRVYFLLDVCLGGELFTILRSRRYFNEPTARFYAASVCEGFDYMHSHDIIYRDLKPENLVLDSKGYLKIADFGFAKKISDKTYTLCGTPDYLCPEIVTGQGHGKGCDWWTLGILIYEMLASFPPFVADEPIETYRKIIRGRIRFPRYFSQEVRDLIRGLLHNKPTRRLGVLKGGADNIRKHVWYKNFEYAKLLNGSMPAPIINKVKSNTDFSNFQQIEIDDTDALPIDPKDDFDDVF